MSTFKDHFSGHADDYAKARPQYPKELFDWVAEQCRSHALAWDAGCGNGQASIALANHFDEVIASDPSATQIASAMPHPNIRYAVAPAEQCSLPDNTVDCVCVAQALHWFEFERFFSEAKRVLRDEGLLVVWTYERSSVNPAVDAVFEKLYRCSLDAYWPPERKHVETAYKNIAIPFNEIPSPNFELCCDWTLPQYLAYLRSWSASQRYLKATGKDAVAEVEDDMLRAWEHRDETKKVTWPLTVRAGRFRKG